MIMSNTVRWILIIAAWLLIMSPTLLFLHNNNPM